MKQKAFSKSARIVSLALAVMLVVMIPFAGVTASATAMQGDYFVSGGFAYVITGIRADNGADTVKLYQDENMQSYAGYTGDYTLPETVVNDGVEYTVTEIGGAVEGTILGALEGVLARSVTLPAGLTTVGSRAFADSTLQVVELPTTVTKLASDAFTGTSLLELNLLVNTTTTLLGQAYITEDATGRTSTVVLPTTIHDVTAQSDLTVSGDTVVFGDLEQQGNITLRNGARLSVGGTLKNTGSGVITVEDSSVLVVSSALGVDGRIVLKSASAGVINNSSAAIRVTNVKGETVVVLPGNNIAGDTEPADDPEQYPQITATEGGKVTVLERGKVIEITADEGYVIESVLINGYDMGTISRYEFAEITADNTVVVTFAEGKTEEGPELPTVFTDVTSGSPYAGYILFLVENGICSGVGNDKFAPNSKVDRGTMLSMLYNAQSYNADFVVKTESTEVPYFDVNEGDWYYAATGWAVNAGIANRAEKLNPAELITREEFAVALYRYTQARGYAAYQEAGRYHAYVDAAPLNYEPRCALTWAATAGYLTAENDKLNPAGTMTRAELAQAMALYLQFN